MAADDPRGALSLDFPSLKILLLNCIASRSKVLGPIIVTYGCATDFWMVICSLLACGACDRCYFVATKRAGNDFVGLGD